MPPADIRNTAVWPPSNKPLTGSCEHIQQSWLLFGPSCDPKISAAHSHTPDRSPWPASGQTHTGFMDFLKQRYGTHMQRQHRWVPCVRASHQLSRWKTRCYRWGLASPLSPINPWDTAASKETLSCPRIQSNQVASEPAAPCWTLLSKDRSWGEAEKRTVQLDNRRL